MKKFEEYLKEMSHIIDMKQKSDEDLATFTKRLIDNYSDVKPNNEYHISGVGEVLKYNHGNDSYQLILYKEDKTPLLQLQVDIITTNGLTYSQIVHVLKLNGSCTSDQVQKVYWLVLHTLSKDKMVMGDNFQSIGGKKLWEKLLKKAISEHYEVGVYDHKIKKRTDIYDHENFNVWYKSIEDKVFSYDTGNSTSGRFYTLYIKD